MLGIGNGMLVLSTIVIVQQYFEKRRAMASGIAYSGFSLGTLGAGPFVRYLIDVYTWRGALMMIAGIFLQLAVLGTLYRPLLPVARKLKRNDEVIAKSIAAGDETGALSLDSVTCRVASRDRPCSRFRRITESVCDFSLMRNPKLTLFLFSNFFGHFSLTTFLQHIPSRAAHHGIEPYLVALLPTISGCTTSVSRILFGFVADIPGWNRLLQFSGAFLLSGILQMVVFCVTTFSEVSAYVAVRGFINGQALKIFNLLTDVICYFSFCFNMLKHLSLDGF